MKNISMRRLLTFALYAQGDKREVEAVVKKRRCEGEDGVEAEADRG